MIVDPPLSFILVTLPSLSLTKSYFPPPFKVVSPIYHPPIKPLADYKIPCKKALVK